MWDWFFVEPFGLPAISVPLMLGVSYFAAVFSMKFQKQEDKFDGLLDVIGHSIGMSVLTPLVMLGFAYVVTLFM